MTFSMDITKEMIPKPGNNVDLENGRDIFNINQVVATISMIDTSPNGGLALLAGTEHGYLVRIELDPFEALTLARQLLNYAVIKFPEEKK